MPDLEKHIAETLAAHDFRLEYQNTGARVGTIVCGCGNRYGLSDSHRAHVAERINYALAPAIAEAQAEAWDAGHARALTGITPTGKETAPRNPYRSIK